MFFPHKIVLTELICSMRKLKIKHIGPVQAAEVTLRRFNFFIGPQSSGKSTIAKVLSTCTWIEKEAVTSNNPNQFALRDDFLWYFVFFHKMEGYFCDQSEIDYESDAVRITYVGGTPAVEIKGEEDYSMFKICYIPAERNMVTLTELRRVEFGETNIRSFLFDWFDARESFVGNRKMDILHLGTQYFYDSDNRQSKDRLSFSGGQDDSISLGCASSGLQSVTPLVLSLNYFSRRYFEDYGRKNSRENKEKEERMDNWLSEKYGSRSSDLLEAKQRLSNPHQTSFIVEEPEQNLFPDTQSELLDEMVRLCCGERRHELTVTTHSPYILNQLNLMFKRFDMGDAEAVGLDYDDVSVYAVDNGGVADLKVRNAHLVNPEYLSAPIDRIYEMYDSYGSR